MKTHEKAGLTGAMKNLVGVNGHKEYLPHHMEGSFFSGGDSYCSRNRFARWAEEMHNRSWDAMQDLSRISEMAPRKLSSGPENWAFG